MAGASIGRPGRERPRRYRLIGFPAVAVQHDTLAAGAAPGGPVHTSREANRVGSGSSWTDTQLFGPFTSQQYSMIPYGKFLKCSADSHNCIAFFSSAERVLNYASWSSQSAFPTVKSSQPDRNVKLPADLLHCSEK